MFMYIKCIFLYILLQFYSHAVILYRLLYDVVVCLTWFSNINVEEVPAAVP